MQHRFGTDGIRGIANRDLTPEFALRLGRAVAANLGRQNPSAPILIGRDTRCSGPMLEGAFLAGILSMGRNVRCLGIAPTPAVALLTQQTDAVAGVMISASHNPIEDNGFKIFDHHGLKLAGEVEAHIETALLCDPEYRPTHGNIGILDYAPELLEYYLAALTQDAQRLDGYTVVIDAAYGAAWEIATRAIEFLGARVIPLHCAPDGTRINVKCGATDLTRLGEVVRETAADGTLVFGVAFDGDADRVRFVDESGDAIEGDAIMLAMARDLQTAGVLARSTVVGTVMSNLAYERELLKSGIRLVRTPVGDRFVLEGLRKEGAIFGGEPSGHCIDLRRNATGDGPATAIAVLGLLKRQGRLLGDLARDYTPFPQALINVRVHSSNGLVNHPRLTLASADAQARLGDRGRLLIRESGTEPLVRVMVEGEDPTLVHELARSLALIVEEEARTLPDPTSMSTAA